VARLVWDERTECPEAEQAAALEGDPNAQRIAARDVGKEFENVTADVAREGAEQAFDAGKTYVESEIGAKGIGMAAGVVGTGGKALGRELGALKTEERALAAEERAGSSGLRGSNNPTTRASSRTGQEEHRQLEAELRTQGYDTEVTIKLEDGTTVRKDAMKGSETVIIKPDTVTGRAAAEKRADLMKKHGYDPNVKPYDPNDPRYQPGSPTYIGPKKNE
jgi:hypothetical protein